MQEQRGPVVIDVDRLTRVRRAMLALQNIEGVGKSIPGLSDDAWRAGGVGDPEDSDSDEAAVRDALTKLGEAPECAPSDPVARSSQFKGYERGPAVLSERSLT